MGTKCSGCDAVMDDSLFMECSQERCKKKFHLKCLALTKETVEAFSQEYKNQWICPECACTMPKRCNANTPVRGSPLINKTFSPCSYVNTAERGSRRNNSKMIDSETQLLDVIQEFRWEVKSQLEEQRKEYVLLQNRFIHTETELKELKQILKVVHDKASKVDILEARIKVLIEKNENLEESLRNSEIKVRDHIKQSSKGHLISFASVVKDKQTRVDTNNLSVPASESVATKSARILSKEKQISSSGMMSSNKIDTGKEKEESGKEGLEKEENWTVVNRRKNKYSNTEIKKGGNTSTIDIQGTEKKKYLHVWRLQKETTEENLEKYVKKIFVEDVPIKVEKIKHKTERDYSSFIIGVPESKYEILCNPENWAVNIEFAEWVWFRRSINKPKSPT